MSEEKQRSHGFVMILSVGSPLVVVGEAVQTGTSINVTNGFLFSTSLYDSMRDIARQAIDGPANRERVAQSPTIRLNAQYVQLMFPANREKWEGVRA